MFEFDDANSLIQMKLLATGTFGSVCMEGGRSKTGLDLKSLVYLYLYLYLAQQHLSIYTCLCC